MTPQFIDAIQETAYMFAFLATELTLLFLAVSYLVGVLQEMRWTRHPCAKIKVETLIKYGI